MKKFFISCTCVLSLTASAITIDPNEFFAFSNPFAGNQTLFLSRGSCPIKTQGVKPELLRRFEVKAFSKSQKWFRSMTYVPQLGGTVDSCWTEISKDSQPGVLACTAREQLGDPCFILAQSYFRDTKDLPKAPGAPRW